MKTCETKPTAAKTFLYNCKTDLWPGGGIPKGKIVSGSHGFAVAECKVPRVMGKLVSFCSNRQCIWKYRKLRLKLPCMAKDDAPAGIAKAHAFNYIVAKLTDAQESSIPCDVKNDVKIVRSRGKNLVTLEIARFTPQCKKRRAELLSGKV